MQQNQRYGPCYYFMPFSMSKPGAYISHSATGLPTAQSAIQVLMQSGKNGLKPVPSSRDHTLTFFYFLAPDFTPSSNL